MAWIKLYSETTESAKLLDLANRLEVNEPHAIGLLAFLWAFTERNAWQTGDLGRWTDAVIAKKCGWEGDPAMFIQALQLSGWLDPDSKKVHEWTEHQTDLIRMRSRNLSKPSSDKVRTNSELSTDKVPAREDKRREEEIREEKKTDMGQDKPAPVQAAPKGNPLIDFPLPGDGVVTITDELLPDWQKAYPSVDIRGELSKMRVWLLSNPARRKTAKGVNRFIANWLEREQNKSAAKPAPAKTEYKGWP